MMPPLTDRLAELLATERTALLSGRLADLGPMLDTKKALVETLSTQSQNRGALAAIEADLARNARLYEAALAGLREGEARAAALRRVEGGFATYDRDGRPRPAATPAAPALRRGA